MSQQFANQAQSVLNSAYTSGDTTLAIVNGAVFPSTGNFTVALGVPVQFYLVCSARSGNTLTVTTVGQEGTTVGNMPAGTPVTQVITAAVMNAYKADVAAAAVVNVSGMGTYANLPNIATVPAGAQYRTTDSLYQFVSDGSAWQAFVGSTPVTLPVVSGWSWVNQGGATVDTSLGGITLTAPASSSTNYRLYARAVPTAPYTIDVGFIFNGMGGNYQKSGICWRDSGSGKLMTFYVQHNSGWVLAYDTWSSPTSGGTGVATARTFVAFGPMVWMRIADNNAI